MIDKCRLDNLLWAFSRKRHWLEEFCICVNDRSLLFGPRWHSMNRRYEIARDVYEHWYHACTQEERTLFHAYTSRRIDEKYRQREERT